MIIAAAGSDSDGDHVPSVARRCGRCGIKFITSPVPRTGNIRIIIVDKNVLRRISTVHADKGGRIVSECTYIIVLVFDSTVAMIEHNAKRYLIACRVSGIECSK